MMTPTIKIHEFRTEYRNGKAEDWVRYSPVSAPLTAATWEKISRIIPPDEYKRDTKGLKRTHMNAIWSMIEPAYTAWKNGQELPENGIPLSAWPGINAGMAEEFKRRGVRTVEDVAGLTDGQIQGIHLPDVRGLRRQAQAFLDARDGAQAAERLTKQDQEIAALKEQLAAAMQLIEESRPKRGRPRKDEQEAA